MVKELDNERYKNQWRLQMNCKRISSIYRRRRPMVCRIAADGQLVSWSVVLSIEFVTDTVVGRLIGQQLELEL